MLARRSLLGSEIVLKGDVNRIDGDAEGESGTHDHSANRFKSIEDIVLLISEMKALNDANMGLTVNLPSTLIEKASVVSVSSFTEPRFLLIGLLDRNRFGKGVGLRVFVECELALDHIFDCEQMFAAKLAQLKVRTTALRFCRVRLDCVVRSAMACLRGNKPSIPTLLQLRFSRYFNASLLSGVHAVSPFLEKTQLEAYNLGCLGHIASTVWLNVSVGVSALTETAKLAERVGFEPTGGTSFDRIPRWFGKPVA